MRNGNWRQAKEKELKSRISKLAEKLNWVVKDVIRWGPQKSGNPLKMRTLSRSKRHKHFHRMAQMSLRATRKKIYKLQQELKLVQRGET